MDRVMLGTSDDLGAVARQLAEVLMFGCARHRLDADRLLGAKGKPR
jgi:hypothetical protein